MKQSLVFISSRTKLRLLKELLASQGCKFILVDDANVTKFDGFNLESLERIIIDI